MSTRPWWVLILAGCTNGKDEPAETAEETETAVDSEETAETAETDTAETDTGETGETGTSFASAVDEGDIVEATDVAVSADGAFLYVVGFDSEDQPAVFQVDLGGGAPVVLHAGAPLVQPSGLALADDGTTLYVADVASEPGATNGAIYTLGTGGGALTLLTAGTIDLPGDVAAAHGSGAVYVSGYTTAGAPALFTVSSAGAVNVVHSGEPLVDPLALATAPAGDALYVVDALASAQRAAVFQFDLPDFRDATLAGGLGMAFPGGLATDGTFVYASTTGDPGVIQLTPDSTSFSVLDTLGLLELPAGLAASGNQLYVAELSRLGDADVYVLTY